MLSSRKRALASVRRRMTNSTAIPDRMASVSEAATGGGSSFAGWAPALSPADTEQRTFGRDQAVARARDLVRNEPLAEAGLNRKLDMVMGMRGLRFSSLPDGEALGLDTEQALDLANGIERVWREWSEDALWRCDWEQDENWGGLCNLMARHYFRDNEAIAVLRWDDVPDYGFPYRTSIHVVDPDRLSNPDGTPDTDRMRAGIESDGRRVIAYHIRNQHPNEWTLGLGLDAFSWTRVPRMADFGRPIVLHLRRKERAGEVRGWGSMMTALRKFKDLSRYTDAEIQSAVVRAVMAMVVYSDRSVGGIEDALSVDDLSKYAEASSAFYGEKGVRLADGTRIQKLFPTERVEMLTSNAEGGDFEAFSRTFTRHIASALDLSYEQLSMDWSQSNYSSARSALLEVWRSVESFVDLFTSKVAKPVLLALLDDALGSGKLVVPDDVPDIFENPRAWLNGLWLGPARGWVDPVKEPMGAGLEMEIGSASHQDIAARQGRDWQEIVRQRVREQREYKRLGIDPPKPMAELAALTASQQNNA